MRKGQAALEFLSTYGFAFLALFIVLGAISYTGIFNFSSLRNNECRISPGLLCRDFTLSQTNPNANPGFPQRFNGAAAPPGVAPYVRFVVTNGYGVNITIQQWNMTDSITHQERSCAIFNEAGGNPFPWQPSENRTAYCSVPVASFFPTQRYDGSISLQFIQTGGAYPHQVRGHFSMVAQ